MKLNFSSREQRLVLMAGAFALLGMWVYSAYFISPLLRAGADLGRQVRSAREQLSVLEDAVAKEAGLREQQQHVSQVVESLRAQLPTEEEVPAVIEHLSDLASQTGVKIQAIFPQRSVDTLAPNRARGQENKTGSEPLVYTAIPIQIDALAGYHQLGAFLSLVETSDRPMEVITLRIAANQKEAKRHTIKMLLRLYFAITEGASAT